MILLIDSNNFWSCGKNSIKNRLNSGSDCHAWELRLSHRASPNCISLHLGAYLKDIKAKISTMPMAFAV